MENATFFARPEDFEKWLETNHLLASELWVGFFRKATGRPSLTWPQSVDVALCFGWIDGLRRTIDAESYKIRFSPRNPNSAWSAVNVGKVEALIEQGRMRPAGLKVFENRRDKTGYAVGDRNVPLAPELVKQFRANGTAWKRFSEMAPAYRRDSTWWVMSAKKEDTRRNRLKILMASSESGERIPALRIGKKKP